MNYNNMFLNELNIVKKRQSNDSFVGIRNNSEGKLEFLLPHGFENFPEDDYYEIKNLFFLLYSIFKRFEKSKGCKPVNHNKGTRDNLRIECSGYTFKDKTNKVNVLYSRISLIDDFILNIDNLDIVSILQKLGNVEAIDYSKFMKYLDNAIYLEDDMIYIADSYQLTNIIYYGPTDVVEMYCFIYCDIKQQMIDYENIDPHIRLLSNNFRYKYLSQNDSLFDPMVSIATEIKLKETLYFIYKNNNYKDELFWHFYDLLESFLYNNLW